MQYSVFYSYFQRKQEHNHFQSWPQWNTNTNDEFYTGLWKRGLRAWSREWAGTAEGRGCKTLLPVLLVPEPWKVMQATASSFLEGISVPQLLVGGVSLAAWGSPFLLHPSSAPSLFPAPFRSRNGLGFYPWAEKITFSCTSEESETCVRQESPLLQCDYYKGEFCERFFPSPKRCFHIFSLFPHRFSLSVHGLLWQWQQKRASWPRD